MQEKEYEFYQKGYKEGKKHAIEYYETIIANKNAYNISKIANDYIQLHINPKPKYIPKFIWSGLINLVLAIKPKVESCKKK